MSADAAGDAEAPPDGAHGRLVGPAAHHRHHDEDEHELPADEQGQREEVQEADERPGVHAGGYSSTAAAGGDASKRG